MYSGSSSILIRTDDAGVSRIVPPVDVITELNQRFPMDDSGMYFTLVYGILHVDTLQFEYASAGHPPILRVPRDGPPEFLEGEGFAVGWDLEYEFDQQQLTLAPGDRLLLYSDGVSEAMNDKLEPFENEQLVSSCLAGRASNLQTAVDSLRHAVESWCGTPGPKDDVSILAAEIDADGRS